MYQKRRFWRRQLTFRRHVYMIAHRSLIVLATSPAALLVAKVLLHLDPRLIFYFLAM